MADSVLRDGGNIMKEDAGVLLQVATNCTVTHNSISQFRYTGVSVGWSWDYGPTATKNKSAIDTFSVCVLSVSLTQKCHDCSTVSWNSISTIGMGELSDLGCVYHLGENEGHVTTHNTCTNVSSFSYGGNAFYTDQGSQGVEISFNLAHHVKCAGFLQNFGTENRKLLTLLDLIPRAVL